MASGTPWNEYYSFGKILFYVFFWNLFENIKIIWRFFNRTLEIPLNHARLEKIILKHNRWDIARREDFVTLDEGFISFETLKSPEWTVYSLDKDGATFVELPNTLSHYTIDKYPFIHTPIYGEAIRVAHLNLDGYILLCEELEMDNNNKPPKTLYFSNTARCGSTLFGAMLQHDGYSTVIAEHHSITHLSVGLKNDYWNEKEINCLLPATIKYLRKGIPSTHLFVYKCSSPEINLVPYLTQHFPEMKHIFMFRKKGLNSVDRMCVPDTESALFACSLFNFSYSLGAMFSYRDGYEGNLFRELKPKTIKEMAMILYGAPYLTYKQNIKAYNFPIVWYNELLNSPKTILSPIFEKLDIPQTCIPDALARTQHDSQANTNMSQKNLKNVEISEMTHEIMKNLKFYAHKFQMEPEVAGLESRAVG